jgi:hypothetical protein
MLDARSDDFGTIDGFGGKAMQVQSIQAYAGAIDKVLRGMIFGVGDDRGDATACWLGALRATEQLRPGGNTASDESDGTNLLKFEDHELRYVGRKDLWVFRVSHGVKT